MNSFQDSWLNHTLAGCENVFLFLFALFVLTSEIKVLAYSSFVFAMTLYEALLSFTARNYYADVMPTSYYGSYELVWAAS